MPNLLIRNIPQKIHQFLKQEAQKRHHSLNSEVIELLETAAHIASKKLPTPIKLSKPLTPAFLEKAINEGRE